MSVCRKKRPCGPQARAAPDVTVADAMPALRVDSVTIPSVQSSSTGEPTSTVTEQYL